MEFALSPGKANKAAQRQKQQPRRHERERVANKAALAQGEETSPQRPAPMTPRPLHASCDSVQRPRSLTAELPEYQRGRYPQPLSPEVDSRQRPAPSALPFLCDARSRAIQRQSRTRKIQMLL